MSALPGCLAPRSKTVLRPTPPRPPADARWVAEGRARPFRAERGGWGGWPRAGSREDVAGLKGRCGGGAKLPLTLAAVTDRRAGSRGTGRRSHQRGAGARPPARGRRLSLGGKRRGPVLRGSETGGGPGRGRLPRGTRRGGGGGAMRGPLGERPGDRIGGAEALSGRRSGCRPASSKAGPRDRSCLSLARAQYEGACYRGAGRWRNPCGRG